MKTSRKSKMLAGALMAMFTLASPMAYGQATRTWVSGVGDDANPGSRTAPCKTFAGAISKTATNGEIDCIDPGGFGAVTITKSITIDGQGTMGSILAAGSNGVIINAGATGVVTLRNLSINGAGTGFDGIRILAAAEVNIENCVISEFTEQGVDIAPTVACRVNIKNSIIRGCNAGAVYAHPGAAISSVVTIADSHILNSLIGFRADDRVSATLSNSVVNGNTNHGVAVVAAAAASRVNVSNCTVTDNGISGLFASGALATIVISQNTISQNGTGINPSGGTIISFGNNRNNGNTANGVPSSTIGLQ